MPEYYGEEMILKIVLVAVRQNFKATHSPGITLTKFVDFPEEKIPSVN